MLNFDKYDLIFWDFDGVIKESVSVKTHAYIELFRSFGIKICKEIEKHHLANGGMSRYEKIPIYLKWAGVEESDKEVQKFCNKFSDIVKTKVIASAWVPGVQEFLKNNNKNHIHILVSATPQSELEHICKSLGLSKMFYTIYGAPASKSESIKTSMLFHRLGPSSCIMIGDSQVDVDAAQENNINFIFRRHRDNLLLNINPQTPTFENFYEL